MEKPGTLDEISAFAILDAIHYVPFELLTDEEMEMLGRYEENAYFWRMMKVAGHKNTYIYELDGYDHGSMAAPAFHILKNHVRMILKGSETR